MLDNIVNVEQNKLQALKMDNFREKIIKQKMFIMENVK